MSHNWNRIAQFSLLGGACSLAVWMSASNAEESSVLVTKPTAVAESEGPVLPPPANPNQSAAGTEAAPSGDVFAPPVSSATAPPPSIAKEPLPTPPQTLPTPPQAPTSSTAKRPFMRPAEPRSPATGRLVNSPEPMPVPEGQAPLIEAPSIQNPTGPIVSSVPGVEVRPTPPIDYDTDHDARKMYRASGKVNVVMLTKDPADGCAYEIPMCIPGCCIGEPRVSGGHGLLGRGVVEYCWPCGFRAIVKFRHVLGDIRVDYEGD